MANTPRYQGFIDPPYIVILTDDTGSAIDLTGCVSNSFTLTMLNNNTGQAQQGVGVWTVANQTTNKGQASYQWTVNDMATKGDWWVYTTVKLPAEPSPREFDPELIEILAGTVGAGAAPPGVLPAPAQSLPFLNLRDYGLIGDGITDNTTEMANIRAAARALGGATIVGPPGTYVFGNQDISTDVNVYHDGGGAIIYKLKNGANTDLFSGWTNLINLSTSPGTGSAGGVHSFGFSNMILDGNKANQSSGPSYCLRFYGYDHILTNVVIRNGYSGGVLCDWDGGGTALPDSVDSRWSNIKAHDNGGAGIRFGGPHDSQWVNVTSFSNGSHGVHLPPHATGMLITNLHCWGSAYGVLALALLSEASAVSFVNCSMEGSDVTQVALLGVNSSWVGGRVFNPAGGGVFPSGIQIGCQAGQVPYPGMIYQAGGVTLAEGPTGIYIKTLIDDCTGANGAIWVANDGGNNVIDVLCRQTAGKVISSSGLNGSSSYHIKQNGLTPDGSQQLGGLYTFPVNAFSAVVISDAAGHDIMNVNTASRNVSYPNGTAMQGYSDNYSTLKYSLNATGNGEVKLGNSSSLYSGSGVPSSGLGTNGDFYFRTDTPGTANQRLYVKSSGTWSGIL